MPFATLAARAAVSWQRQFRLAGTLNRIHTGERQLHRYLKRHTPADHIGLADQCIGRVDGQGTGEPQRQRRRERRAKGRRGVWKRIVSQRPEDDPLDSRGRAVDARLGEQHDVSPMEIHVLVGGVVARRTALHRPVRGGIHVAHIDRKGDERSQPKHGGGSGQKAFDAAAFGALPGETDAHINRLDGLATRPRRLFGDENGAVESAGQQNGS